MGIFIVLVGVLSIAVAFACTQQPDKPVIWRRFAIALAATGLFAIVAGVAMLF